LYKGKTGAKQENTISLSDTDKMWVQLLVDVQYFGQQLQSLFDINTKTFVPFQLLMQEVIPAEPLFNKIRNKKQ